MPQRPCAQEARSFLAQEQKSCQGLEGRHELNAERAPEEWGKGLLSPEYKTESAEPTCLLTWAPPVFSVTCREREKTDKGYVFDVFEEASLKELTKGSVHHSSELKKKNFKFPLPTSPLM